jgi:hypothetical protein
MPLNVAFALPVILCILTVAAAPVLKSRSRQDKEVAKA